MATQTNRRKKLVRKLQNKYRLVVLNDQTFEERFSLRLTPMNLLIFGGTIALGLIVLTLYLIAFTPLREYIPGYADVNMRRNLIKMTLKTDTLAYKLEANDRYLSNILAVVNDSVSTGRPARDSSSMHLYDTIRKLNKSEEDSLLRAQIEGGDRFQLNTGFEKPFATGIGSYTFFAPVKGAITTKFNTVQKHFGVDIVAGPDEVIKCALDGTVVFANWTSETGYVIAVQHSNNLFTIYKHNSALLKSAGEHVNAGEVLAIIGNTGEYSNGPHLHFELWYNGSPVNPVDYINF